MKLPTTEQDLPDARGAVRLPSVTISSLTILRSERSEYCSTAFSRILTCRLLDGSERRLMLKRGGPKRDASFGHRGGVPYETEIYRRILQPLGVSVPEFAGAETDSLTGETALILGFVEDAVRLDCVEIESVVAAARWIGNFHRINESRTGQFAAVVNRYDAAYYLQWAQRALELNGGVGSTPWLPAVCARFPELAAEMLAAPATLIHGEYYPHNILAVGESIVPLDWESAAIGMGEIDLASMVEGWPDEDCRACRAAYQQARWPAGVPDGYERRFTLACIYWMFRWLGDPLGEEFPEKLVRLRQLAEESGIL